MTAIQTGRPTSWTHGVETFSNLTFGQAALCWHLARTLLVLMERRDACRACGTRPGTVRVPMTVSWPGTQPPGACGSCPQGGQGELQLPGQRSCGSPRPLGRRRPCSWGLEAVSRWHGVLVPGVRAQSWTRVRPRGQRAGGEAKGEAPVPGGAGGTPVSAPAGSPSSGYGSGSLRLSGWSWVKRPFWCFRRCCQVAF